MAEYYRPRVPEGQHLGNSREQGDGVVGHLFSDDENKLKGHAVWEKVEVPDEDDYDYSSSGYQPEPPHQLTQEEIERAIEAAALIVIAIAKGVQWASPRVKRWWVGTASPKLRAMRGRLRGKSEASQSVHLGSATVSRATFVASTSEIERAVARSKVRMSSGEWQLRFQAMLAAGAFQEEQRRILSNALIDDDRMALEASGAAELTPREIALRVQKALEAHPSLLTDANFAELMKVLRRPNDADGDDDITIRT